MIGGGRKGQNVAVNPCPPTGDDPLFVLADDLFTRTIHHKQTTGLFRIAHLSKQAGTKQNAPDSFESGAYVDQPSPKCCSTTE